jgi:peptidoglycan/xylan/chitin deacetylase (PgdA/CDA1 family)
MFIESSRHMRSRTWRSVTRHTALSILSSLYSRTDEIVNRPRVQFIYLHHIFPDEEQGFFRVLLELQKVFQFVSYSEAVQRVKAGTIDRPYLTLSFDDGFKSCVKAARIMSDVGARACFFICPSIIGVTDENKIKAFCEQRLHTPPIEFMTWGDLESLLSLGHEVGAHTVTHPNLAQLPLEQVKAEIHSSREELQRRVGAVKHFAWPFGKFKAASQDIMNIALEAGLDSCASGERGCHVLPPSQPTSLCLRRDHVLATWPISHINYFLTNNSKNATRADNEWPRGR